MALWEVLAGAHEPEGIIYQKRLGSYTLASSLAPLRGQWPRGLVFTA